MSTSRMRATAAAVAGAAALLAGVLLVAPASADAEPLEPEAAGQPAADATDAEWYAWSEAERATARATDWAADAAQRGCTLLSVEITDTTMPEVAAQIGAPADVLLPVVDRREDCAPARTTTFGSTTQGLATAQAHTQRFGATGADCSTTSGPGSLCVYRSGNYVVSSFAYYGGGSISGYMSIYKSCGSSPKLVSSGVSGYTYGVQRSVSVYSGASTNYSARFWRYVGLGHYTNWGSACGYL
ncbi:hypothetical protein EXU48_03220 [Occultella glacieicola]|uniref:Uncharacterized protein n=1 Tax=Occultella glacieicola TaxID=2518684 RepID=A0ABY2E6R7_9MICO|nr:hypothetical protein [Occultella glacieicola]TDE97235.1 hypothetical protein EXU48_03220 [Occultella glacieicola]